MRQRASNLIFKNFLTPFEIENVIFFCHDIPKTPQTIRKREGALGTKVKGCSFFEGDALHTAQARPLILCSEEAEAPQAKSISTAV